MSEAKAIIERLNSVKATRVAKVLEQRLVQVEAAEAFMSMKGREFDDLRGFAEVIKGDIEGLPVSIRASWTAMCAHQAACSIKADRDKDATIAKFISIVKPAISGKGFELMKPTFGDLLTTWTDCLEKDDAAEDPLSSLTPEKVKEVWAVCCLA